MTRHQKTVHLPEEHVAYLQARADANDTSFNEQAIAAVEYAIADIRENNPDEDTAFRQAYLKFRKQRLEDELDRIDEEMTKL